MGKTKRFEDAPEEIPACQFEEENGKICGALLPRKEVNGRYQRNRYCPKHLKIVKQENAQKARNRNENKLVISRKESEIEVFDPLEGKLYCLNVYTRDKAEAVARLISFAFDHGATQDQFLEVVVKNSFKRRLD